jgi:ABC-type multidrug transport system fused ATPase/permease subunit
MNPSTTYQNFRPSVEVFFPASFLLAPGAGDCLLAHRADDYLGVHFDSFFSFQPGIDHRGILISAVLIWDSLFRSHISYTLSFLEEMWSRNLANLFVSPLRSWELILSLSVVSMIRTLIGMVPAALLAIPFFGVSVFELGLPLLGFFLNLVFTGWAISQAVTGIFCVMGWGQRALPGCFPFSSPHFPAFITRLKPFPDGCKGLPSTFPQPMCLKECVH